MLSVVVITKNEARNIRRCLDSVSFADEIIVVDNESTDGTLDIASEFRARIITVPWRGYGAAKQTGVDAATGDWVFSIDADEEVSKPLAEEIRQVINGGVDYDGYIVPRRTNFLGRWIGHSGWYPDPVLRLFRRDRGRFDEAMIHEKVVLEGQAGRLKGDLLHYSYPDLETYFKKFNRYTTMGAQTAYERGRKATWFDIVVRPPVSLLKHYVVKQGFRDGLEGFTISVLSSAAVLVKYAKLRDMAKKGKQKK